MRSAFALLCLCACGEQAGFVASADTTLQSAIMQSTPADGDPQVFLIQVTQQFSDHTATVTCNGTLISSRTMITAAHCVDAAMAGASSLTVRVTNVIDKSQATDADFIPITVIKLHPSWDPGTMVNDFAMLLLKKSPNVPPAIWNSRSVDGFAGKDIRVAGYGATETGGVGQRRTADATCAATTITRLVIDQRSGVGACYGDGGGPMFYTFGDGVERLVGINASAAFSGTDPQSCNTQGLYGRVDQQRDFILGFFVENESPECVQDGMCRTDCVHPDVDCLCKPDGFCSKDCPNLLDDPDCPRDCIANDICSQDSCPVADPDCIAIGNNCTQETQCKERACINDAQNDDPYCSMACLRDADCPGTMVCNSGGWCIKEQLPAAHLGETCHIGQTRCTEHSECAGGTCVMPCGNDSNCKLGEVCSGVADGIRFCKQGSGQNPLSQPDTSQTRACNAGGLGWWLLCLLIALQRLSKTYIRF